jgi:hypothetical protein
VETRDIDVHELVGAWFVCDLPVGAVLRAAIGWTVPAGFEPLSVAMDVTAPPAEPEGGEASDLSRLTSSASHGGGTSSWPAMTTSPSSTS